MTSKVARKRTLGSAMTAVTLAAAVALGSPPADATIRTSATPEAATPATAVAAPSSTVLGAHRTAAARAVVAPRPSVSPAIVGERVVYSARLATARVRPVVLQVRRTRGWITVAKGSTTARGDVRLAHAALTRPGKAQYRFHAPAVTKGRKLPAVTTGVTTLTVANQSARITLPASIAVGGKGSVTAQMTPVRSGRPVVLQRYTDEGEWATVAKATQDRRGRAALPVTRIRGDRLRVLSAAANGAPAAASSEVSWPPAGAVARVDVARPVRANLYNSVNWAAPDDLTYATDRSGAFLVMGRTPEGKTLRIDRFDGTTLRALGAPTMISLAGWSEWGGLYAAPDGHVYVLVGNLNEAENDAVDVIAVRKYDPNWKLVGTATVKGGEAQLFKGIWSPFWASAAHMALVGDRLVVHMGRGMYGNGGVRHQSNFTFEVDVATMTTRTFDDLNGTKWDSPYVSHSFQTLVTTHGSDLVFVDHGDAYPRAIRMNVIRGYPQQRKPVETDLMTFNGAIGDNATGASVTGLVSGPSGVVVVGNSVRHEPGAAFNPTGKRNVFTIAADPKTGAHQRRWLTSIAPAGSDDVGHPRVVTLAPDRFAVLFTVKGTKSSRLEYRLLDSTGAVLAQRRFAGVDMPAGAEPIAHGGRILWVGADPDSFDDDDNYLFALDTRDPMTPTLAGS